eukprot:TRINITY_DN1867_c0_g1_i1.p1 TRINITY_DN1867_c0_g1~~TRINITY_DN1867_c0_g1_i1.p1  ORF type:complete len:168 (-),score=39.18 TRINITY_DN1867_c0_g1_i1:52-555(-)
MATQKINDQTEFISYAKANDLRKNGHVLLGKVHPCRIADIDWAQPGKHGSAKLKVMGYDIFTDKKVDDIFGSGDNVMVPIVHKTDYQLQFILDDNYLKLMSLVDGRIREDLKVNDEDLADRISELYAQVEEQEESSTYFTAVVVTVLSAMGKDKILEAKIQKIKYQH